MGSVALVRHPTADERAEVGYWVAAPCRGRGAATRAVRLVTDWGFAGLGVARVELLAEPENLASQRVAAAAGFVRERVLHRHRRQKGRWRDFVLFSRGAATSLPHDPPDSH
jgi:RimJ/RimL family protein N-acetyltransferase